MDLVFAPSQIETWPIGRLRPYARNAKIHDDDQVAKIAASMAKFGWTVPCMVADDGELIAGHGRVLAATMLGLKDVPVIRLGHLDEAERRAYRIADNKLTELGDWDAAMLRDEIAGLLAEDFDLSLLGITDADLDALLQDPDALGDDGAIEGEDDIPEPPVTPVSVAGDIWQLGSHRLICGDSTSADVVGRLLGDVKPLLMVTDPPYGVEYDPSWRNQAGAAKTKRTGKVLNDDRADWRAAWALFPGDVAYVWHGALHAATVAESLVAATREGRSMRSFALPWIPHDDVILPGDIQGQPALGTFDGADPLVEVMNRKLTLMRRKHAQTREYMEMNALRGIVKDGAGTTLYNYFTEFGLAQISVDFVLGTAGTNVQGKVREVLRAMEDNLLGESMSDVHALVSREFFDKLISHPKTEEAYKFYAATGAQPLRQDVRRNFPFAGIVFEEYAGTVTLSTKATERLVPASEGIAFPLGTMDTFTTYGGPANLLEAANTIGLPLYARQHLDEKGRWIDLMTEASILPVNKRPRIAIRLHSFELTGAP